MRALFLALVLVALESRVVAMEVPAQQQLVWVHGENLSLALDATSGSIQHINATDWEHDISGRSFVSDAEGGAMQALAAAVVQADGSGAVVVKRSVRTVGYGTAAGQPFLATLTDTFSPCGDASVGGIVWRQQVATQSKEPWRAVVGTELQFVAPGPPRATQFWLPINGDSMETDVLAMRNSTAPGYVAELGSGYVSRRAASGVDSMPLPVFLWSGLGPVGAGGLVVAPRLNDTTIAATAQLNASFLQYGRLFNKLTGSAAAPTSFTTHLCALREPSLAALPLENGSDDPWRDAMRQTLAVNPAVFKPVVAAVTPQGQPTALSQVGLGIYTCARANDINVSTTIEGAGATTLWDASFWWPYIGLFIPPVLNRTESWISNVGQGEQSQCSKQSVGGVGFKHGQAVTATDVATHLTMMREVGVTLPLSYFNLFEFGQNVQWPLPPPVQGCTAGGANAAKPQCWSNSSVLLSSQLADAVLTDVASGAPIYTWQNAILLDPGIQSYKSFLVAQAKQHSDILGTAFRGVVIDRTDHTTMYSHLRDDNETWCGAACASMLRAWLATAADVSEAIHSGSAAAGGHGEEDEKLILINYSGGTRAELLTSADGIFSEAGDQILNSIGLSAVAMPAIAWTYPRSSLDDAYMQRHLRMGVMPMAPVYGADHSLSDADAAVDKLFWDYGPLFRSLRSTDWYLDRSAVISLVPGPNAGGPLHNVFQTTTPRSSEAPFFVVLALADDTVDSVAVTLLLPFTGPAGCQVHLPGLGTDSSFVSPTNYTVHAAAPGYTPIVELKLTVRLWKGCALLACSLE